MDKLTVELPSKDGKWSSYVSKYPADSGRVPVNGFTSGTRNVITSATGQADKRQGGAIWNASSLFSASILDQYEGVFSTGARLFIANDAGTLKASTGNGTYSSITAGFTNPANFEFETYQSRVYGCNGVDSPICMDIATSYGGVPYVFTTAKTKVMGAQAPGSAATATRNTDSTVNQVPAASHTYKITFVYYSGVEESNGSASSAVCVNDATHTSNALTAIPVGGYGCTGRNIYRDANDGNYLLLASINDNTTTTYTDILPIGSTPTPLSITNALPPIFKYIALYLDRLFVIDVTGKIIAWSNAGQPDIFNPSNVINGPADDVMTAVYVFNGLPYVFGQHTVGTILGTTDGTFYYNQISSTTGCVDNRSIQTRNIVSVPTLIWLATTPNKGLYYTNGTIVQYMSDFIEDLTFNLAQVSYLSRQNTQASQSAFQGGTSTSSIDLLSNPGTIQTINPKVAYSHAAEWAAGIMSNMSVIGDTLQVPTQYAPSILTGPRTGDATIVGSNIVLATNSFSGESQGIAGTSSGAANTTSDSPVFEMAQKIVISTSTIVTGITFPAFIRSGSTLDYVYTATIGIYANGVVPGSFINSATQVFTVPHGSGSGMSITLTAGAVSWSLTPGTYYIGVSLDTDHGRTPEVGFSRVNYTSTSPAWSGAAYTVARGASGNWVPISDINSNNFYSVAGAYTTIGIATSGTWTALSNDTASTTNTSVALKLVLSGSYPTGCSATVSVQGSTNNSSWVTTDTLSNPTGTISLVGGTYRYWRVVYSLVTTNNQNTPALSGFVLDYDTTGVWTSPAILCTTDITSLVALTLGANVPFGTTALIQIATSASIGSGYSAFSSVLTATPNTYAKIKVTLTTDTGNTVSAALLTTELDWTVSGTLTSSIIDTGAVPAGWGIFQFSQVGTSGTVQFFFRSASTSGGIPGASFVAVSNGSFPASSPLEFCQWKVVMTAGVNNIPQVNSVTVNWLLSNGKNVRAASLFFNKSYYLAVALQGSTANDTLIEYDYEGNWRVHSGVNIGTMGTYFNDAFYADSTVGKMYNGFKLPTDNGTNITFDLRTKCFDGGDNNRLKVIRSLKLTGVNTGTTLHTYYSVDRGTTWYEMFNSSGTLGYTTTTDNSEFVEYFVPNFAATAPLSGRNVIFRVVSNDALPCSILNIKPVMYMRKGKAIREGGAGI